MLQHTGGNISALSTLLSGVIEVNKKNCIPIAFLRATVFMRGLWKRAHNEECPHQTQVYPQTQGEGARAWRLITMLRGPTTTTRLKLKD